MDGWMDGWVGGWVDVAGEEDDGGRRERVKARLDDASRLFGRVSQIGPDFKSPTKHSSLILQSPNFCEPAPSKSTLKVLLRFWSPYSAHGR